LPRPGQLGQVWTLRGKLLIQGKGDDLMQS